MKKTRKQKIDEQRGRAADRAFDPIRKAIDEGRLVITPLPRLDNIPKVKRSPHDPEA